MNTFKRVLTLSLTIGLALSLNGCAMMFAREEMPDITKIGPHSTRAQVEDQLGLPVSDVRTGLGKTENRKCVYQVLVKNEKAPKASKVDNVVDSMVGFKTFEYRVIYDRNNQVIEITQISL